MEEEFFGVPDFRVDVWDMAEKGRLTVSSTAAVDLEVDECHKNSRVYYTDGSVVLSCGGAGVVAFERGVLSEGGFPGGDRRTSPSRR